MNRAEIADELERIRRLLDGPMSDDGLVEARRGLEVLGETLRSRESPDAADCPFEPGRVELVGLQWRTRTTKTKTETKTKTTKRKKRPSKAQPTHPAPAASNRKSRAGDRPLTGRIAAMARGGVPTDEIVALYRIRPEHVAAFVAAFVEPAIASGSEPDAGATDADLTRCPTPP